MFESKRTETETCIHIVSQIAAEILIREGVNQKGQKTEGYQGNAYEAMSHSFDVGPPVDTTFGNDIL